MEKHSLQNLENDVSCGICQEHYTDPKVLPCLHYYCKECILKLALGTGKNKPFSCPECRSETKLPEGGVDKLKSAFFANRFKSHLSALELTQGKVKVKCEACSSGDTAVAFCRQCAAFICNVCVEAHQRMKKMFAGHEVVSIQDLKEGKAKADITMKEPSPAKCLAHQELLKVYCFDCDRLICRDCTLKDHRDHNFELSAAAAPIAKENFLKKLEPLRKTMGALSTTVKKVQTTKQEVEVQGDTVANTIHTSFNELFQIMETRKQEMLAEAARIVQESKKSPEIVEQADMGVEVRCAENLQQLCRSKANITQGADPAQCTVKGEGTKAAKFRQRTDMVLTVRLHNSEIASYRALVTGQLKSVYNQSVIQCDIDRSGPGEYLIHYTPTVRGHHELTVLVDGQHVAGSPFPVFASIHPTQLGKPVSVWDNLNRPSGISVNSNGEVLVAKTRGDAIIFYKQQKITRSITREQLKLADYTFTSIPVDKDDYIYLTSYDSNKIMKLSKDGTSIIKEISEQESGHLFIAVAGEEVMVSKRYNKGTIIVYDRELNYVRKITGSNMGELRGLATDPAGNIYATDWDKKLVHVFSPQGKHLRSFGEGILTSPLGLCVSGQFVYICDNLNYNIYVFTIKGELVTRFGQRGAATGRLMPEAMCADKDGFMYICDTYNNRVQVF